MIIWIIGISGTGKTTIGKKLFDKIRRKKSNTVFEWRYFKKGLGK